MLDGTRGLAPPPSPLALRVARLKKLSAAARRGAASRRRFSELRLAEAERLLGAIIDGSDLIGEITLERGFCAEEGVALFVTMRVYHFRQLCRLGAELEDMEDGGDAEETDADVGELPLGWGAGVGPLTGCDELEPSLGSTHMSNQARWAEGHHDGDLERDGCDNEENGDLEHDQECEGSLVPAEGHSLDNSGEDLEADVPLPPELVAAARTRLLGRSRP